MPVFRFKGFPGGVPVALSASDGTATRNTSVASWGPSGTGRVSITRTGSTEGVGEAIIFDVIDITGMTTTHTYKVATAAEDQEIEWFWTITAPAGAATTWSSVTRLAPGHNSRLTAYGRRGFIIPDAAGTWTFDVIGVDKNGATLAASESVTVNALSTVAADAASWLLHDGDLTGAPAHDSGRRYSAWESLMSALKNVTSADPIRVRFKGGATWSHTSADQLADFDMPALIFEKYGTGKGIVNCTREVLRDDFGGTCDVILQDLIFNGEYSAVTEQGAKREAFFTNVDSSPKTQSLNLSRCEVVGWGNCFYPRGERYYAMVEDCHFGDWGDFGSYPSVDDVAFIRGSRIEQPANHAHGGGLNNGNNIGAVRQRWSVVDGCTMYHAAAANWGSGAWILQQPTVRIGVGTDTVNGTGRYNWQRCVIEGGIVVQAAGTGGSELGPTNLLIERCTILGATRQAYIAVGPSGVTVRNCQVLGGSHTRTPGGHGDTHISINSQRFGSGGTPSPGNNDPVRIINNTIVDLQSGTQDIAEVTVRDDYDTQVIANNTSYGPNFDPPWEPDGALVPQAGTTPLYDGARMNYTVHEYTLASALTSGTSTPEIPWWTGYDGRAITKTLADGGAQAHGLFRRGNTALYQSGLTFTTTTTGVTIRSNSIGGPTIEAGTIYIMIDLRHDQPGIIPGTAAVAEDGRLYAPASAITPDDADLVPYYDFFGEIRDAAAPTSGAIDPG